jgi:hypothetical protein
MSHRYTARIWWPVQKPIALVPALPLSRPPRRLPPRILPEGNASVRTIRAIEAQIASLAPVKETTP